MFDLNARALKRDMHRLLSIAGMLRALKILRTMGEDMHRLHPNVK